MPGGEILDGKWREGPTWVDKFCARSWPRAQIVQGTLPGMLSLTVRSRDSDPKKQSQQNRRKRWRLMSKWTRFAGNLLLYIYIYKNNERKKKVRVYSLRESRLIFVGTCSGSHLIPSAEKRRLQHIRTSQKEVASVFMLSAWGSHLVYFLRSFEIWWKKILGTKTRPPTSFFFWGGRYLYV